MARPNVVVRLDNELPNYFCGQTVSGNVILQTFKDLTNIELKVQLQGGGNVHWKEQVGIIELYINA